MNKLWQQRIITLRNILKSIEGNYCGDNILEYLTETIYDLDMETAMDIMRLTMSKIEKLLERSKKYSETGNDFIEDISGFVPLSIIKYITQMDDNINEIVTPKHQHYVIKVKRAQKFHDAKLQSCFFEKARVGYIIKDGLITKEEIVVDKPRSFVASADVSSLNCCVELLDKDKKILTSHSILWKDYTESSQYVRFLPLHSAVYIRIWFFDRYYEATEKYFKMYSFIHEIEKVVTNESNQGTTYTTIIKRGMPDAVLIIPLVDNLMVDTKLGTFCIKKAKIITRLQVEEWEDKDYEALSEE